MQTLIIMGDLTDAKDYHPAELPNRLVGKLTALRDNVRGKTGLPFEIVILMGNHDYLKEGAAFFAFLNALEGIRFITKPTEDMIDGRSGALFLPHSRNPAKDWAGMDFSHFPYLFMHQTIKGAIASNGEAMEGEALPDLTQAGKIYSGDIHVPQVIGPIEYVGSPYHVHYGDDFKARCVLLDRRGQAHDLHFKSPRRVSVKVDSLAALRKLDLARGDYAKVTVCLAQSEKGEWPAIRRRALELLKEDGIIVHSVKLEVEAGPERFMRPDEQVRAASPDEALVRFVEAEDLSAAMLETAYEVME